MQNHFDFTDIEFEKKLDNCSFDPALFSHEAHLRLAWILIKRNGIDEAEITIQKVIKKYVTYLGAEDKYNVTLTLAVTKAVYHFMCKSKSHTFSEFIREFPRLRYCFKELMATHYGIDIYNSLEAKREFVEPDLLPFS